MSLPYTPLARLSIYNYPRIYYSHVIYLIYLIYDSPKPKQTPKSCYTLACSNRQVYICQCVYLYNKTFLFN